MVVRRGEVHVNHARQSTWVPASNTPGIAYHPQIVTTGFSGATEWICDELCEAGCRMAAGVLTNHPDAVFDDITDSKPLPSSVHAKASFILSGQYRLSHPADTPMHLWEVR